MRILCRQLTASCLRQIRQISSIRPQKYCSVPTVFGNIHLSIFFGIDFIKPRYTWGPIYGPAPMKLTQEVRRGRRPIKGGQFRLANFASHFIRNRQRKTADIKCFIIKSEVTEYVGLISNGFCCNRNSLLCRATIPYGTLRARNTFFGTMKRKTFFSTPLVPRWLEHKTNLISPID